MKRVRVVRDIAHTKVTKPRGISRYLKSVPAAILKLSRTKIPFLVWLVVILAEGFCVAKIAPEIVSGASISQLIQAAMQPAVATSSPQETMAQNIMTLPYPIPTSSATSSGVLPEIQPGLLPVVQLLPPRAMSMTVSTPVRPRQLRPTRQTVVPTVITAESLLNATTLSVFERYDGPYKIAFTTNAGTYGEISWNPNTTLLVVDKSLPSFAVSFYCDPQPNLPTSPTESDQSLTFNVTTFYACTISLAPTSGSDRRTQSKQFSFTTGAGQLVVTPSITSNLLRDTSDLGGFVFTNDDTDPVTVTGLDIDVSYRGLDIANTPLDLRFEDPSTGAPLYDFNMETLAAAPSLSYAYAGTDIRIPLSFTVSASSQKVLPVDVLGAQAMDISGINPTVTIVLRQVTTNQTSNKTELNSATISWSCIVPVGVYVPNATSGPWASGQVCQQ